LSKRKKIAVATFGRSDWGLLRNLLFELKAHEDIDPFLIAAGSHFLEKFGKSMDEIKADGFVIDASIDCISGSSNKAEIVQDMGRSLAEFGKVLNVAKPDLFVLLGDRFETLTAASAALVLGIPIAHINGGEVTEGAFDDSIRHSITKMASLHFVSNSEYEKRVLQLGEDPKRVHAVGHLGLDSFRALDPMDRPELEQMLGMALSKQIFLVTIHPATFSSITPEQLVNPVLEALDSFPEASIVFTSPNPDPGHEQISQAIQEFVRTRDNCVLVDSLGHRGYLSLMLQSTIVIGNSSSGVLEAPIAGIPSIDVGDRQKGRIAQNNSIGHCATDPADILAEIHKFLDFAPRSARGDLHRDSINSVSSKIVDVLGKADPPVLIAKTFWDTSTS
jgi:UDP-hydrolysing UDP-N-acetyl-D-glucosamine 2-epimerase